MVCTEDGHVNVSISQDDAVCDHEKETKDCCKPVPSKPAETPSSCCDFNNTFLQLQESSLVFTPQTTTGHVLSSSLVLFAPPKVIAPLSQSCASSAPKAPPALCRKQHQQSITKVIRI